MGQCLTRALTEAHIMLWVSSSKSSPSLVGLLGCGSVVVVVLVVVDVATVAEIHGDNHQLVVLDIANHPVIPNPVAP